MKNNKGFTLVELLAVIVVLSIVLGLTVYIALNAINKAKEKSYQVTINNIEKEAGNYLLENKDRLFYISQNDTDYEYQCITVQNLLDLGYLKNDIVGKSKVSSDKVVDSDDYIYVERDKNTIAITKSLYDFDNKYGSICGKAVIGLGDIDYISVPDNNTWSNKKEITIKYRLKNVNDVNTLDKYEYGYTFYDANVVDNNSTKTLTVTKNGTITGTIKLDNDIIVTKDYEVGKIDTIKPVIALGSYTGAISNPVAIALVVTDSESGVNYSSFTKEDIDVTINGSKVATNKLGLTRSGNTYTLTINGASNTGNMIITIDDDKVFDKAGNGNNKYTLKLAYEGTCNNLIYNGNNQTLISNGTNVTYSNQTRKNAGSQNVTVNANSGYVFIDGTTSKTVSCSIAKKEVTVTADNKSINYGSNAPTYSYSVTNNISGETAVSGTATYTVKNSSGTNVTVGKSTGAGTYTIVPSGLTAGNNYKIKYVNGILTINKVAATITCQNKNYNGSAQTIATCSGGTIAGASKTNVGEYTVTCTGDANHTDATSKKCSINKVDATCPTLTDYNKAYDGNAHTIGVSGGSGGTIQYRTSTTGNWSDTKPTRTNVGTTTVYVQVAGNANHNTKDCGSRTIKITESGYTLTADANGGTISATSGWTGTGSTATKKLTAGSVYGTLPVPTKDNGCYMLKGWYTAKSGGTEVRGDTKMGSSNTTIYARYQQSCYSTLWYNNPEICKSDNGGGSNAYFEDGHCWIVRDNCPNGWTPGCYMGSGGSSPYKLVCRETGDGCHWNTTIPKNYVEVKTWW